MDVLKLVLSTKFMKGIVTKIITKAILKKTGYNIDIQLNKVEVENADGKICLHMDVDAAVETEEFVKMLQDSDLI